MIDPATNLNGETFQDYNMRRWGGSGWTHNLKQQGQSDGFGANFQNWKWWPHTLKAHRFISYVCHSSSNSSSPENKKINMVDTSTVNQILFEALYEQGENISLQETLVQIGTTHPLLKDCRYSPEELATFLSSQEGVDQVEQEIQQGRRQYQISSVPFFIIEASPTDEEEEELPTQQQQRQRRRPYGISGAQQPQTFVDIFEELWKES